jgi:hypothetical protein
VDPRDQVGAVGEHVAGVRQRLDAIVAVALDGMGRIVGVP